MASEQKSNKAAIFLDPLLKANPLFVMVLGTCPAIAVTKSIEQAVGMAVLFLFVLFCSSILVSALRRFIPDEIRTPSFIVIIATFVTLVDILTKTFLPELYTSLGTFISLIVVNCIALGRADAFASKNTVVDSMLDALGNGLGYGWAIIAIAAVREIFGVGYITIGAIFDFLPMVKIPLLGGFEGSSFSLAIPFLSSAAGGFLVLGLALGVIQAVSNFKAAKKRAAERAARAATAAAKGGK